MVRPMMLCPSARSIAATVEESTPPDMATAMVRASDIGSDMLSDMVSDMLRTDRLFSISRRQLPQPRHGLRQQRQSQINILLSVLPCQAQTDAAPRTLRAQSHCGQHVRGLN